MVNEKTHTKLIVWVLAQTVGRKSQRKLSN